MTPIPRPLSGIPSPFPRRARRGLAGDDGVAVEFFAHAPVFTPSHLFPAGSDGAAVEFWRHAPVFTPTHLFPEGTDGAAVEFFQHEVQQ